MLLATTVVLAAPDPASAASFTQAPTRLYMTPAGESLPGDIAEFVGVQQGQLVFDGSTDPISQQVRSIVVDTLTGAAGCDLSAPPYDIDDCSRVQLGPVNHGRLWMGAITTIDDGDGDPGTTGPADDVYLLPSGARIDATYSVAAGSYTLGVNGTPQQLNDALADLVYTPDAGYYYVGSFNPENLLITVIPGNSDDNLPEPTTDNDSADHTIEIRVLNVNEFPSITAPADKMAQAGVELLIPAVAPGLDPPYTGTEYAVSDPDNDEDVDGAEAEPPVAEDPLPDGEHAEMLLIGYLDCGVPTTDLVNGFHLRGGAFQVDSNSVRSIVRDFFDYTSLPAAGQAGVDTVLDAIDAIEPGLTTLPLASNDPTDFTSLFAGIGTMSVVQYALSQVTFLQPAPGDTCTLWTAVSDLGNNGLPLQYFGTPPTGLELPMIGLDIDSFDITTGDLDEIDISFDAEPLYVDEGAAPVEAAPVLHITPAIHPEFTIRWEVNPRVGDPDVAGVATANSDFTGTFNNTLTIPENATIVSAPPGTNVLPDSTDEGNETFTFDLVLDQTPPAGWMVTSTTPQRTVVILDDDDADAQVTSFGDAEVIEGDAGTSTMTFTIELDKPADGTEQVSVGIAPGGSATNPDDFGDPVPTTVSFSAGSMTATVDVPVVGDLLVEGDHSFELTLSGGVDVTIVDGTATGTIRDDDGVIGVSVDDVTVTEGDAGTTNATFTLTLDEAPVGTETIRVTTGDGSATVADGDYDAATQDVAFTGPGTTATFTVLVNGDTGVELDETFTVTLSMPVGLVIVDGEGIGTITNDDAPPPDPAVISVADAFVSEGGVANETTITMTNPGAFSCYVTLTSANGTATAPGDYAALALDLIIPANTDTLVVPLDIVDDDEAESAELFSLTVALAAGSDPRCEIGDGTATVYIAASDGGSNTPPFVTIDQAVGQPDPTSDSPILFTVEFTEAVTGFDAGDISFAGSTTDAVLTPTVTGGPQTYTVSVAAVGATVTGTVVASIPAGAASDGSAPSGESTSTDNSVLLVVDT